MPKARQPLSAPPPTWTVRTLLGGSAKAVQQSVAAGVIEEVDDHPDDDEQDQGR